MTGIGTVALDKDTRGKTAGVLFPFRFGVIYSTGASLRGCSNICLFLFVCRNEINVQMSRNEVILRGRAKAEIE